MKEQCIFAGFGGQGMLLGTVIGAFIWGVLNNGLQFAGAPLALRNIVIGIVVIISVLIDRIVHGGKRLNTNAAKGLKLGGGREKRDRCCFINLSLNFS